MPHYAFITTNAKASCCWTSSFYCTYRKAPSAYHALLFVACYDTHLMWGYDPWGSGVGWCGVGLRCIGPCYAVVCVAVVCGVIVYGVAVCRGVLYGCIAKHCAHVLLVTPPTQLPPSWGPRIVRHNSYALVCLPFVHVFVEVNGGEVQLIFAG